ncbi:MAG TPA: PEGA domain-containing protein [Polyangiales bacterium]|nr:PEGA domain-containing protein [Polyangiales bacterium]
MRVTTWVLFLAVLLGGALHVAAQATQAAPDVSEARVARARKHFLLGMQFFEVRAYRDAIREFERATELAPSADVWFNIGRAREELGEDEQAKQAFERYLRDRVDAPDREAVRARIERIDERLRSGARGVEPSGATGSLRIHLPELAHVPNAAASGTRVTLDGKQLSARPDPIILPAGRHRLEVTRAGFVPFRAEVAIEPGMLTAAHAQLQPLTQGERSASPSRTWTWIALGLAGAGAVATGVFGAIALDKQADGAPHEARTWAQRSDVALAGTAVCALSAVILYFVEGQEAPRGERAKR